MSKKVSSLSVQVESLSSQTNVISPNSVTGSASVGGIDSVALFRSNNFAKIELTFWN